jgi:predicted GIY-YIG superfamily endonuclease
VGSSSPAWVYLLRCADGSLYCGWTSDLDRRLAAHAAGRASRYTRSRLPVTLAAALPMPDRGAARREEARIKRLPRAQKLALAAAAAGRTCRPSTSARRSGRRARSAAS